MLSLTILGAIIIMVEGGGDAESGWHMALLFTIALLPVILGAAAMGARDVSQLPEWRRNPALEIVADVLIIAAILPATILWQEWISGFFSQNLSGEGWGMKGFAGAMAMFGFAIFYAAPRLVLVFENLTDRITWISLAIAALPTLRACLVP
jgi:hypothetical protein